MKQKTRWIASVIASMIIISLIIYFESQRINPEEIEDNKFTFVITDTGLEEKTEMKKEGKYSKAPELVGIAGYLNTEEGLKISDLKGKVVLIDFWTYTCINCIRTFPFLIEWDKKYRDKGLVIIGVHTPEFQFEKKYENVKNAIEKYGIEYAVVQDNDYATWRAFNNRWWPHKYLIDSEGYIRYDHVGEGAYDETERVIQELLSEITEDVDSELVDVEDKTPKWIRTPELYAGYGFALSRGQNIGNPEGMQKDKTVDYAFPEKITGNKIYLDGKWKSNSDDLQAVGDNVSIILDFTAKSVNIVGDTLSGPVELEVFIDEEYIKEEQAGEDVQFDDERAFALIDEPRLYNVVEGRFGRYILKLTTSKDFTFNAFTFG